MVTASAASPLPFLPGQTIGIDLGTTYSAVAQMNSSGVPVAIKNAAGETTTPSVIILGNQGHITVGPNPDQLSHADPRRVVQSIKREMGNPRFTLPYENRALTPEFLSALILKKLKVDAEKQIGAVGNAVITVPYYFNDLCRRATQNAGAIAGLNVVDIINEPTAATLAYAWMRGELGRTDLVQRPKTIMVYDLGGGTFDVTVVRYSPTEFQVVATDGDMRLGGIDWTYRIVQEVAARFVREHRYDPRMDPSVRLLFEQKCEQTKRELSNVAQVQIELNVQQYTLQTTVTRADFEAWTSDLTQRTKDTTELVLEQASLRPTQLDEILLVGGSTHMPIVPWILRSLCGKPPSRELNPDLAVAQGAAIHAAILQARTVGQDSSLAQPVLKRLRGIRSTDVNSHSLGVIITDPHQPTVETNHIMIPRNTPIPHRVMQRFMTTSNNPSSILIKLVEGESPEIEGCTVIGEFRIEGIPHNLPAGTPVEVYYSYDSRGRIHASARELSSNRSGNLQVIHEAGLTDAGLQAFQRLAAQYTVR